MPSLDVASGQSSNIPVLDISGYLNNDTDKKAAIVKEFKDACETWGFAQIAGHGISQELQKEFLDAIAAFFAQPIEEKLKVSQANSNCNRGYESFGGQQLEELEDGSPDQKESFSVRPEGAQFRGKFNQGQNQWPTNLPGFKETIMKYQAACHNLSVSLFRIMSLSLGLGEHFFDDFAADPDGMALCRVHHYPPAIDDSPASRRGVGAHTDFGGKID